MNISRRVKILVAFVLLVSGGYFVINRLGLTKANGVPLDFKDARFQGAIIAQDIVNLSNEMSVNLERVNQLDHEEKYADALNETMILLEKSQDIRKRAVDLSAQLEKMTGGLATIKDSDARTAALESITNRLAIISRLLSYSDYLTQLLNALRDHFGGTVVDERVQTAIQQINAEVTAINNFNRQAGQAMDRFDEIIKRAE